MPASTIRTCRPRLAANGCCCCPKTRTARRSPCGQELVDTFGTDIAVIICDSFGRAWRKGTVGIALGAAGLPALIDMRGQPDLFGRELLVTETGFADEIAAAAGLLMGQADEAVPMVLVRGLGWSAPEVPAAALIRPAEHDLFR